MGRFALSPFPAPTAVPAAAPMLQAADRVGLIKVLSCQKFRSGVRIEMLCGRRALEYLSNTWAQNRLVAQTLSAKPEATYNAVVKLQHQLAETSFRAVRLEEAAFAAHLRKEYAGKGDVLLFQPPMPRTASAVWRIWWQKTAAASRRYLPVRTGVYITMPWSARTVKPSLLW